MSLNTSTLGTSTMQVSCGGSNGLFGVGGQRGADNLTSPGFGANSQSDTVNQLAGMLTGMMMMMMMMNTMGGGGSNSLLGGGLGGGLGGMGGGLGGLGDGLGSGLGGGIGAGVGGALGGPLGASLGSSLGSSIGGGAASGVGSTLDRALGLGQNGYSDISNSGSDANDPMQQLMKLFSEVMQSLFGDDAQGNNGTTAGRQPSEAEQNAYNKGVTDALSALIGNGISQGLGNSGPAGGQGGTAGTGLDGSSLGGKGLQNLSGPVDFRQLGEAIGTGVAMKAGIQALNDIGTHSIDQGDRAMAKEVGQFMDQYPEVFGQPESQKDQGKAGQTDDKSWAQMLSQADGDGLTPASMDQFNKAKGIIKSAMAGDTGNGDLQARGAGGSSLGIDAMMAGDAINNMALGKLSGA